MARSDQTPHALREERVSIANPFGNSASVREAGIAATALVSVEQQRAIAEVQARMIIARSNPRDPLRVVDAILVDCTRSKLAEAALYSFARGGTDVTGPSIRLMESIARRWGNIASGIKELARRDGYSDCVSYAWDLETGYYDERQYQIRHWRDTKGGGYRLTDERDIYELIANMGQRRKRAVLQAVIPGDVVEVAVEQCEQTLKTKADTSPDGLQKMLAVFSELGVTKGQIETRIQRRIESITPAQMVQLRKIWTSINDGMSEVRDWFEPQDVSASSSAETTQQQQTPSTTATGSQQNSGQGETVSTPNKEAPSNEATTQTQGIPARDTATAGKPPPRPIPPPAGTRARRGHGMFSE